MAIDILIVKEDLNTALHVIDSIDINNDFYKLRKAARELRYVLIATIDDAGETIINRLQLPFLQEEINALRLRADINHKILDSLEEGIRIVNKQAPHFYIKFIGD